MKINASKRLEATEPWYRPLMVAEPTVTDDSISATCKFKEKEHGAYMSALTTMYAAAKKLGFRRAPGHSTKVTNPIVFINSKMGYTYTVKSHIVLSKNKMTGTDVVTTTLTKR